MKRKQLIRTIVAQAVELHETRCQADEYARSLDKIFDELMATEEDRSAVEAELDKLRQARASERAQPMPRELLIDCRNMIAALPAHSNGERILLGRLDHAIEQTAGPGDSLKVEHYETGKVTEYHRATPAEREAGDKTPLAFREAVREALGLDRFGIDSAVVAIRNLRGKLDAAEQVLTNAHQALPEECPELDPDGDLVAGIEWLVKERESLGKDVLMRDGDVDDLRRRVRELEDKHKAWMREAEGRDDGSARPLWDVQKETILRLRVQVEKLEADAASYRTTISELRLNPKMRGALEQAYDDLAGPDRTGPPTVRGTDAKLGARPRYEATNILSDGKVIGYMSWDHITQSAVHRWYNTTQSLNACHAHAIAECEKMNREEATRIEDALFQGEQRRIEGDEADRREEMAAAATRENAEANARAKANRGDI